MAKLQIPEKMNGFLKPFRYKVAYGGRGGGKSMTVASLLVFIGSVNKLRIVCAREVQNSIKQSVHQLLSDSIERLGLQSVYQVLNNEIRGVNGTTFDFVGLRQTSIDSFKSFEGVDIVWIEEGQSVSKRSWDTLIPTIRKQECRIWNGVVDGYESSSSEIWVTFNPFLYTDDTYQRFVVNPPRNSFVTKINWDDNPWFPEVLNEERLHMKEVDKDSYDNVWEGKPLSADDMQFISADLVDKAMEATPVYIDDDPLICGIDLARGGGDDCFISFRRGKDAKSEKTYKIGAETSRDSMQVVSIITQILEDHQPDIICTDEGSIGGPISDRLNQLGWDSIPISFGSRAIDHKHYANRVTEMWDRMRKWMQTGGAIKKDERLKSELINRRFSHDSQDRLILEKKSDMKKRGLKSPDHADSLCFLAGTMVETTNGVKPIEDIKVGEYVKTPMGKAKVVIKHKSRTNLVTTVTMSNGGTLAGKPQHDIFVWGRGWVELQHLSKGDKLEPYSNVRRIVWGLNRLIKKRARTMEGDTTFKVMVDIIACDRMLTVSDFFIEWYGLNTMVKYLKGMMYTIKMEIGGIMTSPILILWNRVNIVGCTCLKSLRMRSIGRIINNNLMKLDHLVRNGTLVKKVENGIGRIARSTGRLVNLLKRLVFVVVELMKLFSSLVVRCARSLAGLKCIIRVKERIGNVFIAVRRFLHTSMQRQNVVVTHVQTTEERETLTYNLTLDKENVYYANGVLVANCLTFAVDTGGITRGYKNGLPGHRRKDRTWDYDPLEKIDNT